MIDWPVPKVYGHFLDNWDRQRETLLAAYQARQVSFIPNLLPQQALQWTAAETLDILRRRLGSRLDDALAHADPEQDPAIMPRSLQSPVAGQPDGSWLKRANMVGINVRTVGSFWNAVKYVLTIPEIQDAIHLLPIWEPGVVGSLYGISSWNLNTEFYSLELAKAVPELDTVERQLKAVINLLHALGKTVGMDVIPHTDRFSEIVLAQPHYFEWLQREGVEIVDHAAGLHREVQERILEFLAANGPALAGDEYPHTAPAFFSPDFGEAGRLRVLFGPPWDRTVRAARRNQLVKHLYAYGYEPVPATMAPPFRGLEIDPETRYTDSQGNIWYDYRIKEPQSMSRVFGPLTRYKLYGRLDDNRNWEIDFANPRREVWGYICEKYAGIQHRFGFDFMRGDMSHVQMRPDGVPEIVDGFYDILGAVKSCIQDRGVRYFGYFAETFLAGRNVMVYGDEIDHLEASGADTTLGDLQSTAVGSPAFLHRFRWYYDLLSTRSFAPSFTVMTGDKDDPRFDEYYLRGNALRLFIAFFLADMPSYVALGFETRDVHHRPAPNEHYTKLYVFQETSGPKATVGPYRWGVNGALFHQVTRLKLFAETAWPRIRNRPTRWLIPPDPSGENRHLAWTQGDGQPFYVLVANTDTLKQIDNVRIPRIPGVDPRAILDLEFSTAYDVPAPDRRLAFQGFGHLVHHLAPGEGRAYRLLHQPEE